MVSKLDPTVRFLAQIQQLLREGKQSSTYKFALLQAIADLCVEKTTTVDRQPLPIHLHEIAQKFIAYYWAHDLPFSDNHPLSQNNSSRSPITVVTQLQKCKATGVRSLSLAQSDLRLVKQIAKTVYDMPVTHLQNVGGQPNEFIYHLDQVKDNTLLILPNAVMAFRYFHSMLTQMIRGAWMDKVRGMKCNQALLGEESTLERYLFGSKRNALKQYRDILREHQNNHCFYCGKVVRREGAADHFIAWSRYPADLGHNFVFAHQSCNSSKSDDLAAREHLERWLEENMAKSQSLISAFDHAGVMHNIDRTQRIASWAYEQGHLSSAPLWLNGKNRESFDPQIQLILNYPSPQ